MKKIFLRLTYVIGGSMIMGLGIGTAIKGTQGADPLAMVWEGLSNILPITIGQANLVLSIIMLLVVVLIDIKQINIGTIINPIILGLSTDSFIKLMNTPENSGLKILQSSLGIVILGIGIGIYTSAEMGKGSYDALIFSLVEKFSLKLPKVRMAGDIICLILGLLLGAGFGIATIVAILIIGKIIAVTNEKVKKSLIN